jgi:hypothetical protein
MKTDYNKKADEILNSIENIQKAVAPDFFYTRLRARMEKESEVIAARPWILRPVYTFAALVIVLLVNAFVLFKENSTKQTTSTVDPMQSIAAEYNLNDNSLYDIAQDK